MVSDFGTKIFGGSTDLAKKGQGSADLHTPPSLNLQMVRCSVFSDNDYKPHLQCKMVI